MPAATIRIGKIAAAQGAYVIFVQADLEDGPAIALYRSCSATIWMQAV
jgi:hypothetical protein